LYHLKKIYFTQSDVPIDLLDVEKNSAVVSYSAVNPEVTMQDMFNNEGILPLLKT
jgi:hypothetical protein